MRSLMLLFFFFVLQSGAGSVRAETWALACEENFPPYNFIENGVKTGIDTEIVQAVLKRIGVQADLQVYPWNRVVYLLDKDEVDLAYQFAQSPERMEKYVMVGPIRTGRTGFAVPADSPAHYETLDDLKGLKIGVVKGFHYSDEFDSSTTLTKIDTPTNNQILVRMLVGSRLDAIIGDVDTLRYFAAKEGVTSKIRFLPKIHKEMVRYVAFPKSKADKAERFRVALEAMQADGTIKAIIHRWE
jgi:polar amino acid transport system substrate-binding protein